MPVLNGYPPRLKLEPLEAYMLADDGPRYPRTFVIGLEFTGDINQAVFERAVALTLADEPLIQSAVARRGLFGREWRTTDVAAARVRWTEGLPCIDALEARRIDPARDVGLRIFGAQFPDATRMYHVFHHARCDGTGALALLGRLYAAYSRIVRPGDLADPAPVRIDDIHRRQPTGDFPRRIGSRADVLRSSLNRAWDVLTTRTARLIPANGRAPVPREDDPIPFPGSLAYVVDDRQTRALKRAARRACATLNDLLVAAMFQTVRDWNLRFDPAAADAWYQMMVPVDLRSPEHDQLPAVSLVSSVFVKQHAATCADRDRLVRAVSERINYAVTSRSGLILENFVRLLTRVPGLLPLVLRAWKTQATALVSYVGDAGRGLQAMFPKQRGRCLIGDLRLERINAVGPVRPGTAANLSAGTYAGELGLYLTLDPHQFTATEARVMLEMLVERLLAFAADDASTVAEFARNSGV